MFDMHLPRLPMMRFSTPKVPFQDFMHPICRDRWLCSSSLLALSTARFALFVLILCIKITTRQLRRLSFSSSGAALRLQNVADQLE